MEDQNLWAVEEGIGFADGRTSIVMLVVEYNITGVKNNTVDKICAWYDCLEICQHVCIC